MNLIFDVDDPDYYDYYANDLSLRKHLMQLKKDTLRTLKRLSKKGIKVGSRVKHKNSQGKLRFTGTQLVIDFEPPLRPSDYWDVGSITRV